MSIEFSKQEVSMSIGTTEDLKSKLDAEARMFLISKSRAASILINYGLENNLLAPYINCDSKRSRVDVMEVNLSIGTTSKIKQELVRQAFLCNLTNSKAVNIILEKCIEEQILRKIVTGIIEAA